MTTSQKLRLLLYGFLASAVHFTMTALCKDARLLLQRPEDMIGSGETKPYWPPYPFAEALERVGEILRLPSEWLWTPGMPDIVAAFLFVTNSFLWGFSLVVLFGFVFSRLRFHHEPRVVQNHWGEHGRATSVGGSHALGRPRRSVLSFEMHTWPNRSTHLNRRKGCVRCMRDCLLRLHRGEHFVLTQFSPTHG